MPRLGDRIPVEVRFWRYVSPEPNSGCWLWDGSLDSHGYGTIGRYDGKGLRATHVSLSIAGRPVPDGLLCCHTCDNPPCVNPDHLWAGSPQDNMDDKVAKGRNRNGVVFKDHCKRGHDRRPENVRMVGKIRHCKVCERDQRASRG